MPGERARLPVRRRGRRQYWYHSHQVSHEQVQPRPPRRARYRAGRRRARRRRRAIAVITGTATAAPSTASAGFTSLDAAPGDEVRLRLVNTDNGLATVWLPGTTYRVLAVDGTDVHQPGDLTDVTIPLPAGGRVDVGLTVPESGVQVDVLRRAVARRRRTRRRPPEPGALRDPRPPHVRRAGGPAVRRDGPGPACSSTTSTASRASSTADPDIWWTVNGGIFPDVPMYLVTEGDVVVFEITNNSGDAHPMHLHGHHGLVLSRDGIPRPAARGGRLARGRRRARPTRSRCSRTTPASGWTTATTSRTPAEGLVAHLMYDGVSSSYLVGGDHGNRPE